MCEKFFNESVGMDAVEDLSGTVCDPHRDTYKTYDKPQVYPEMRKREQEIRRKFEAALQMSCFTCGHDALVDVVTEFSESPEMVERVPDELLASILDFNLFYKMLYAVTTESMNDYIYFLYMLQRGYAAIRGDNSEARANYFAKIKNVKRAITRKCSQSPISDIDKYLEGLGHLGKSAYTIVTSKSAKDIDEAFLSLRRPEDIKTVTDILETELLDVVLFELNRNSFSGGVLPKYLRIKIIILQLILKQPSRW